MLTTTSACNVLPTQIVVLLLLPPPAILILENVCNVLPTINALNQVVLLAMLQLVNVSNVQLIQTAQIAVPPLVMLLNAFVFHALATLSVPILPWASVTSLLTCAACLSSKHCLNPALPICNLRLDPAQCVQCLNDAHCDPGYVCKLDQAVCVECTTAAECWVKDPYKPICNAKGGCQACDEDIVCAELFLAYQACHTGTGACVADSYAKGFYVAAVVLGTIAMFFVIIAVVAVIAR